MKKSLIFIFVILLYFSCGKENADVDNPNELEKFTIESLEKFLPLAESNSKTKAVFYNAAGEEIIFDFIFEKELKEKRTTEKTYFAEEISGSYINESINDYSIYFQGGGNYVTIDANTQEFRSFVSAGINQFVEPAVTKLTFDETGTPFIAIYYDTKQLLDKEFKAVYSNFIADEFTAFSEVYYNATYGVIGFKDRKDDLYVFKEFAD